MAGDTRKTAFILESGKLFKTVYTTFGREGYISYLKLIKDMCEDHIRLFSSDMTYEEIMKEELGGHIEELKKFDDDIEQYNNEQGKIQSN